MAKTPAKAVVQRIGEIPKLSENDTAARDQAGARRKNFVGLTPPFPLANLKCGSGF